MTDQAPLTDPPRIRVEIEPLDAGDVLLVYTHPGVFRLVINASASPADIAAALEEFFLQAAADGDIRVQASSAIAHPVESGSLV